MMRRVLTPAVVALALGLLPQVALADGPKVRVDPNFPPLYGSNPGWNGSPPFGRYRDVTPPPSRYSVVPRRPTAVCDAWGRCWQAYYDNGYQAPLMTRPPGWADDLPGRVQLPDRFVRPRPGVVCDRASSICYKRGAIDKTETRDAFGDRAAGRADDVRDDFGTSRLFVPERGVSCSTARQVCFDDGVPDRSLTRRYFGQRAADALH